MEDANFEIRNNEIETLLRDIGASLGKKMPKDFGFTLMIYSYGEGGSMFYISSAQRKDMIKALDEFKNKLLKGN